VERPRCTTRTRMFFFFRKEQKRPSVRGEKDGTSSTPSHLFVTFVTKVFGAFGTSGDVPERVQPSTRSIRDRWSLEGKQRT